MKIRTYREEEYKEVKRVYIEIGDNLFRLEETVDGKLNINKVSIERGDDSMRVFPRTGNEIQIL